MPLRILIVEDEPLIALDVHTIVEDAGHTVAGCVDTMSQALAVAASGSVDVAIMDIELATEPNGVEAARRLRDEHGVRSLFVSASLNPEIRTSAAALDPVGFIDKPFAAPQILEALSPLDVTH